MSRKKSKNNVTQCDFCDNESAHTVQMGDVAAVYLCKVHKAMVKAGARGVGEVVGSFVARKAKRHKVFGPILSAIQGFRAHTDDVEET